MQLQAIDWVVVAVYGLASLVIGIVFTRRASRVARNIFTIRCNSFHPTTPFFSTSAR